MRRFGGCASPSSRPMTLPRPPLGAVPSSSTEVCGTSRVWASALRGSPATNVTSTFGLNKRLVRPMPFLVPLYRGRESRALMRLGMVLYEGLSGFRNYRLHRFMSREETLSLAPAMPVDGLTGGCLYYD